MGIKENADKILYDFGLIDELKKYGTPHIIGSYVMDAMAWNDLDIDVTDENMSLEKLYQLTSAVLSKYSPTWYEAKREITPEGKTVYFHGFETMILGELWNVDIWFFDDETIRNAVEFCEKIKTEFERDSAQRNAAIQIKKDLKKQGLYGQYSSVDVYSAVLENHVTTAEEFLRLNSWEEDWLLAKKVQEE